MRSLILIVVIVYLVGVGVELAPIFRSKWNESTASDLSASVVQALPEALAWPASLYRSLTGESPEATPEAQSKTP
jgi:hypothetical protein